MSERSQFAEKTVRIVTGLGMITGLVVAGEAAAAQNYVAICYGATCTGKDPEGLCSGDAKTVASIGVSHEMTGYAGQLDLRYSPSCRANWGRFTANSRVFWLASMVISGRVTAWNPNEPSQHAVKITNGSLGSAFKGTTWTGMVDGTKKACTGVEVFYAQLNPDGSTDSAESVGWFWGPCR